MKQSIKVIDPKHEDKFWQKRLLGYSSPKILQLTVFFYTGLHFVLWGVQEPYDLVPLQFTWEPQDLSTIHQSTTKNNQHRYKDIIMRGKKVHAYALPGNEWCIVKHLDTYLPLLPPDSPHF